MTARGLPFRPLGADPRAELASARGQGLARAASVPVAMARVRRMATDFLPRLTDGVRDAVAAGADVLLASTLTHPVCAALGEARGIPTLGVYLQPIRPTADFPPVFSGLPSLGRHGNRLGGHLLLRTMDRAFSSSVGALRRELGLPRRRFTGPLGLPPDTAVLHGFSPHVVARPADWPDSHRVCGYWWPTAHPAWQPGPRLLRFLAAGPPPVFVGFGSMVPHADAAEMSALVATALRRAGVRGIVQSGWAGLDGDTDDDSLLAVGEVPHDWLFPRTAAVVHHAGAGTTAAGLRAGVPAVPVPVLLDQHFWASRLVALGAAPTALPFRRLTPDLLADAIRTAIRSRTHKIRARRTASALATEDGTTPVLEALAALERAG